MHFTVMQTGETNGSLCFELLIKNKIVKGHTD